MQEAFYLGHNPSGFHRVAYTEWGSATARPPIICAHGLTRNGRDFDRLATALQSETQVFCPDYAGRGKSDWLPNAADYGYPQYINDMTALIARTEAAQVDWVGTSMGGITGMLLASMPNNPIRKMVINDVGPFLTMASLKRIGEYVGQEPQFDNLNDVEKHMRKIYAPFGITDDADWAQMVKYGTRALTNGKFALAHDPGIGNNFRLIDKDVDFWNLYDMIRCPVLVIHGAQSDILTLDIAQQMTQRGPKATLVTLPEIGHAPALMAANQIKFIADFLRI